MAFRHSIRKLTYNAGSQPLRTVRHPQSPCQPPVWTNEASTDVFHKRIREVALCAQSSVELLRGLPTFDNPRLAKKRRVLRRYQKEHKGTLESLKGYSQYIFQPVLDQAAKQLEKLKKEIVAALHTERNENEIKREENRKKDEKEIVSAKDKLRRAIKDLRDGVGPGDSQEMPAKHPWVRVQTCYCSAYLVSTQLSE